jgi:hypothetical protein
MLNAPRRISPSFGADLTDTEIPEFAIVRNRAGLAAVVIDGNLHLADGRAFELAGREAAWTVDEAAEFSEFPALAAVAGAVLLRREEIAAAEAERAAANAAREAAASAVRAAAAAEARRRRAEWEASPAGQAAIARERAEWQRLWSAVFGGTAPRIRF